MNGEKKRKQSSIIIPRVIFGIHKGDYIVPLPKELSPSCAWCSLIQTFKTTGHTFLEGNPPGETCQTHAGWSRDENNFNIRSKRNSDRKY